MVDIRIVPATVDRFDDAEHALSGGGDGAGCQCQWWSITNAEFQSSSRAEREELLRAEMRAPIAPALIAYVDGDAAGWVKVAPRTAQRRIARTRMITQGTTEPLEDDSVWAVTCFVVRAEHRGAGLNAKLLDAAIAFARQHSARAIEAYPIDTGTKTATASAAGGRRAKHASNELYHGVLSVFERAGFRETARPKPDRPIVELTLT